MFKDKTCLIKAKEEKKQRKGKGKGKGRGKGRGKGVRRKLSFGNAAEQGNPSPKRQRKDDELSAGKDDHEQCVDQKDDLPEEIFGPTNGVTEADSAPPFAPTKMEECSATQDESNTGGPASSSSSLPDPPPEAPMQAEEDKTWCAQNTLNEGEDDGPGLMGSQAMEVSEDQSAGPDSSMPEAASANGSSTLERQGGTRGPKVLSSPAVLRSLSPPGCTIILNGCSPWTLTNRRLAANQNLVLHMDSWIYQPTNG